MALDQELKNKILSEAISGVTARAKEAALASAKNMLPTANYQKNIAQPVQPQKWYAGDQPTSGETLAQIVKLYDTDKQTAMDLYNQYSILQNTPGSALYNPYVNATNQAVKNLASFGVDTSAIDDRWIQNFSWLQGSYVFGDTTNTPNKPGKKATAQQKAAYEYYQVTKAEESTKKAEQEWAALQEELKYWAGRNDMNLSDQQIMDRIDWSKYKTLKAMDDSLDPTTGQTVLEFNRPIGYSKDAMRGVLWASRNNGGTGNGELDTAYSYLGQGNKWKNNIEIAVKLNKASKAYSPYSVGMTLNEEGAYFGKSSFNQAWLDANRNILNSGDATMIKMYNAVEEAEKTTQAAEKEVASLNAYVDKLIDKYGKLGADKLLEKLEEEYSNGNYTTLQKMDKAITTGDRDPIGLTRAVDYTYTALQDKLRQKVADRDAKNEIYQATVQNGVQNIMDFVLNMGPKPVTQQIYNKVTSFIDSVLGDRNPAAEVAAQGTGTQPVGTVAPAAPAATVPSVEASATGRVGGEQADVDVAAGIGAAGTGVQTNPGSAKVGTAEIRGGAKGINFPKQGTSPVVQAANDVAAQVSKKKDAKVAEAAAALDTAMTPAEKATVAGYSVDGVKASNAFSDVRDTLNRNIAPAVVKANSDIVASYVRDGLGAYPQIYEYEGYQDTLTNLKAKEAQLAAELGDKALAGRDEQSRQTTVNIGGITYRVTMADGNNRQIESIEDISSYSVPKTLHTNFYVPDESMLNEDSLAWMAVEDSDEVQDFIDRRLNGLNMARTEEEEAKAKELQQVRIDIQEAEDYLRQNKAEYEDNMAKADRAMEQKNNQLSILLAIGGDTTEILEGEVIIRELAGFNNYEATQWTEYNPSAFYATRIRDGEDRDTVLNDAKAEYDEMKEQLSDIRYMLDWCEKHGVDIPKNYMDNIDRRVAKIGRDMKDYEFFTLQYEPDFEEKAKEGSKIETAELVQNMAKRIDGGYNVSGNVENAFFALEQYLSDEEKNTYYYLLAKDMENGTDKAAEYADFMTDRTYGVLNVRRAIHTQEWTDELMNSGAGWAFLANVGAVAASPYNAINNFVDEVDRLFTGRERNPYSSTRLGNIFKNTVREATAEQIKQGAEDLFGEGTKAADIAGKIAQGGYEILTMRADSALNAAVFGWMFGGGAGAEVAKTGGKVAKFFKQILQAAPMGISAANDAAAEAKLNGASDTNAWIIAGTTFAAETITEAIEIGHITDAFRNAKNVSLGAYKEFLVNWLTNEGISEMFGESVTDIFENFVDESVMGKASDHRARVNAYMLSGYGSDEAEAMARKDEMLNVLRTALISYLSPGLDIVQTYGGQRQYYRSIAKEMNDKSIIRHSVRDVRRGIKAEAKAQAEAEAERTRNGIPEPEFNGFNLSALEGQNQTVAAAETAAQAEPAAPAAEPAAAQAAQADTEADRTQLDTALGIAQQKAAAHYANSADIAKQKATEYLANNEILVSAQSMDRAGSDAAVSSVLDIARTSESGDVARATTAGMHTLMEEAGMVDAPAALLQEALEGAQLADVDPSLIRSGMTSAALGGEQSAARQVIMSNEYHQANAEGKAAMLAQAATADVWNEAVQQEISNAVHENRVAEAECALMAEGAGDAVIDLENQVRALAAETKAANQALETQQGVEAAANEAADRATQEMLANPGDVNTARAQEGAVNQQVHEAAVTDERQKAVENAQQREQEGQQKLDQTRNDTMTTVREQAEANVAQEDQQRVEEQAQAQEQARVAGETHRLENNDARLKAESIIETMYPNASDAQKNVILKQVMAMSKGRNVNALLHRKDFAQNLSKKLGMEIVIRDTTKGANGQKVDRQNAYVDKQGRIIVDEATTMSDLLYAVLPHEVTHLAEQSGTYKELANAVLQLLYGEGADYDSVLNALKNGTDSGVLGADITAKRKMYTDRIAKMHEQDNTIEAQELTDEEALREIIADGVGSLFVDKDGNANTELLNRLASEKPSVARRVLESIKSFLRKMAGFEDPAITQMNNVVDLLEKALKDTTGNPAQQNGSAKYSLNEFEDGKRFVDLQIDQDIFKGHSLTEMKNIAKRYIRDYFQGAVVGLDNKAYVNGKTADEYYFTPGHELNEDTIGAKMKASTELDNLMDAGVPDGHADDGLDGHVHDNYPGGFDYFRTIIKSGDQYYEARINIGKTTKGDKFHNVTDIKNITQDILSSYGKNPKSHFLRDVSMENVSQDKRTVKPSVTSSDGKILTESLPGDTQVKYSLNSWTNDEKARVQEDLIKKGFKRKDVDKWINDTNSIAAMIAADRTRLDFEASDNQVFLKKNNDYYFTLDASTLCAKRLLYQGTFDYVQHALPDEVFTPEDLIDLVNIMSDMGYETPCGICYVESRRRWLDTYASLFLEKITKDPDGLIEKYFKKSTDEEKAAFRESLSKEVKPSIDDLTTSDGLEKLRHDDPYMYKAFVADMNAKGSANPKVVQLRTEYRGDIGKLTASDIQKVKDIGGLRIQSFSDFETPHLLDMIQAVLDMSSVGLTSQAYTKVPNFAWVFGDTGIKINLSLIGKGTGLDENGNLVFDNVEGINFDEAMKLRNRYSKNVGTILVGINDEHIIAAMGDPRIDFIIPFHKSGWSDKELKGIRSLNNYKDYTDTQNERVVIGRKADGSYETESFKVHKDRTKESLENFQPVGKNGYWNFKKSGQWNAENYLKMCAEQHRVPKFSQFLVDNGDGSFSLPQGTDKRSTSIREGYWKTLIDFKMYENDGYGRTSEDGTMTKVKGAEQKEVTPNINMSEAYRVMNEYQLGRQMPNQADGTPGKFIPMESNNSVPVATTAADAYIALIKQRRAGGKPVRPNDSLEATPEIDVGGLKNAPFGRDQSNAPKMDAATAMGASEAPATLGNTETDQSQEETDYPQQEAMAVDAETGETVHQRFSLPVTNPETKKFLDDQEKSGKVIKTYRTMKLLDGKLVSPKASYINGKIEGDTQLGQWEEATEHPELIKFKENGDPYFELDEKGRKTPARYNPYMHSSNLMLNDQFSGAYQYSGDDKKLGKFVTVECIVPESEATSGYQAQYAKDPVGWTNWKAGGVAQKIAEQGGPTRNVFLSRWIKPVRIVPDSEVAQHYKELLDGTGVKVPANVVTPGLLAELEKAGVEIDAPQKQQANKYRAAMGTKYSLPNVNKWFDDYIDTLSADELDELAQEMFGVSLKSPGESATAAEQTMQEPDKEQFVENARDAYLQAVNDGDLGTAQGIIDKIAKQAGYTVRGTHRTNADFTVFDRSKQTGKNGKALGDGFYVAAGEHTEYDNDTYGKNRMLVYINPGNVFNIQENGLTEKQAREVYEKYFAPYHPAASDAYDDDNPYTYHVIRQLQKSAKVMDYIKEAAENAGVTTDVIFKELGYDSIKDGSQYVVFDPEQIKSANPVTYDDQGEMIDPDNRFGRGNADIRYSLPSDAPYLSAVDHGDIDEAAYYVVNAAHNAGYTDTVYHGTESFGFTQFDMQGSQDEVFVTYNKELAGTYTRNGNVRDVSDNAGYVDFDSMDNAELADYLESVKDELYNPFSGLDSVEETEDGGFRFTYTDEDTGEEYTVDESRETVIKGLRMQNSFANNTQGIYELFANPGRQLVVDAEGDNWDKIYFEPLALEQSSSYYDEVNLFTTREIADWARRNGYDSVRINNVIDDGGRSDVSRSNVGDIGIYFHPESLKSADTVTYDKNGNVIPLSERFKASNNDIRYSLPSDSILEQQIRQYLNRQNEAVDQQLVDSGIIDKANTARRQEGNNPSMTAEGEGPQRQFGSQTAQSSDELDQQVLNWLAGHSAYTPDTNQQQVTRAINWIRSNKSTSDSDGYQESLQRVTGRNFNYRTADGQARMVAVMGMAVAKNDITAQIALADAFNRQGTDLGRALQARKIFRLMTPEGRISTLQKMLQETQEDLKRQGRNIDLKFSDWIYQAAAAATEEGDFDLVQDAAAAELADQIPANWRSRLRGWRMLSMLGNPRTHIRNVVGNALFVPAVSMKNKLGAVAEMISRQDERTKTLAPVLRKDVRQFAIEDARAQQDRLTGEAKYKEGNRVRKQQRSFNSRFMQGLTEFNSNALEAEDWFFLRGHYRRALGGWIQANGYTVEQLRNDESLLEKGRQYAIEEAQRATYRDFNKIAKQLNEISRNGGALGFVTDAVLPFRTTPANILRRGIEYSPVGLIRSLTADVIHLHQYLQNQNNTDNMPERAISPNQFIDRLCAGLTGTGIMVIGALLAGAGAVSTGLDDDDDEFEKLRGGQEYAINPGKIVNHILRAKIFDEDVTFTMDWAAPMSMPFFVGAAIYEQIAKGGDVDIETVANAISGIAEPVFNLSMLDGVSSLLKTTQNAEENITQVGAKILANYLSSYVPSALGATARTVDNTRRKSFVESGKGGGVTGTFRYAWEQIENKLPGVSQTNIPVRDAFGYADQAEFAERILENFVLPGYINQYKDDPVIDELERLGMAPKMPGKTFNANGEKLVLTAEQYDQLTVDRGQTAYKLIEDLMKTDTYKQSSDDGKAEMIADVWTYATQNANYNIDKGAKVDKWVLNSRPNPAQGIINRQKDRATNQYKDEKKHDAVVAVQAGDKIALEASIEALKEVDVDISSIKTTVGNAFKDDYIRAYQAGDDYAMMEIEDTLLATGLGFGDTVKTGKNKGKNTFDLWIEEADKQTAVRDEE